VDGLEEFDDEDAKLLTQLLSMEFPGEGCSGINAALRVLITDRQRPLTSWFKGIDLDTEVEEADRLNLPEDRSSDNIREQFKGLTDNTKKSYTKTLQYVSLLQS
jgi:hypothetical protein